MLTNILSVTFSGIDVLRVDVEVNVNNQSMPGFEIVGLPDKAINESKERVRTALNNTYKSSKPYKVVVNLAPADIPKVGSHYDLPLAMGILSAQIGFEIPESSLFFGELSLSGDLKHTKGALLAALFAKENNVTNLFIPEESLAEVKTIEGINIFPASSLKDVVEHLTAFKEITPIKNLYNQSTLKSDNNTPLSEKKSKGILMTLDPTLYTSLSGEKGFDMKEIVGQESAKRAFEIVAAGGHNLLMIGPPGSGKSMMSRALEGILPQLDEREAIEVTKILSICGKTDKNSGIVRKRQFRAPHHTTSAIGLIGGGRIPLPGEITLAHRGILFMDEFSEFPRNVIESMRQPMEDGFLTISRSYGRVTYPARFTLIAASNPCPCGYFGSKNGKTCQCNEYQITNYRKRLSGPILDRIDIHLDIKGVEVSSLNRAEKDRIRGEGSATIRERVVVAREIQRLRFSEQIQHRSEQGSSQQTSITAPEHYISTNSEMSSEQINKYCHLSNDAVQILEEAVDRLTLSTRSYYKIIKLARTIADLDIASEMIKSQNQDLSNATMYPISMHHIAEAIQYRISEYETL